MYVHTVAATAFAAHRAAITCWRPDGGPDLVALLHQAMDVLESGLTPPRERVAAWPARRRKRGSGRPSPAG
ncbi:MAG TPA: hypothetical protein VJT49_14435 [Amycolatopsis sp.]|nr:hypothetical protein [Amycolatopsis sp.]HKS46278.1 hypothetical protein [Amycolatopsis sp.]